MPNRALDKMDERKKTRRELEAVQRKVSFIWIYFHRGCNGTESAVLGVW